MSDNIEDKVLVMDFRILDYILLRIDISKRTTYLSDLKNTSNFQRANSGHCATATTVDSAPTITKTSGVTAGSYGPDSDLDIRASSGSIYIPQVTVNSAGVITSVVNRIFTLTTS